MQRQIKLSLRWFDDRYDRQPKRCEIAEICKVTATNLGTSAVELCQLANQTRAIKLFGAQPFFLEIPNRFLPLISSGFGITQALQATHQSAEQIRDSEDIELFCSQEKPWVQVADGQAN